MKSGRETAATDCLSWAMADRTRAFSTVGLLLTLFAPAALAQKSTDVPTAPPAVQTAPDSTRTAPATPPTPADAGSVSTIEARLRQEVGHPGGLTADHVAARAAQTSIDAEDAELDRISSEADKNRVIYTGLPRLELMARYTRLSSVSQQAIGPDSGSIVVTPEPAGPLPAGAQLVGIPASAFSFPQTFDQFLLQASLRIPISDYALSISNAYAAASHSERAAALSREAARLNVAAEGRMAYYDWAQAKLRAVVAEQSLEQAQASLTRTERALDAGRASSADRSSAKSVVANARLLLEQAHTQVRLADQRMRLLMHDDSDSGFSIGEDLMTASAARGGYDLPALYREAEQARLEMRALTETESSIREQRQVVESNKLPRLEAFGNVYYSRPNQRFIPQVDGWRATWDVGAQITWSPNDVGDSSSQSVSFDAQRRKVQLQKRRLKDTLRQEVLAAVAALDQSRVALSSARQGVKSAEHAYQVQQKLYDNGRATTFEVIQAEGQLLDARVNLVNTLIEMRVARAALDHAVGRDVPANLRPARATR